MNTIIKHIAGIVLLSSLFASCDKVDYPNRFVATDGVPVVNYIRYADQDIFISQAYMDEVVCVVGENLRSVHQVLFNDQEALLNTSYITDNTLIVSIPSTQATTVDNKIHLVTASGDKVDYDFKVLPPSPKITSISHEWAEPGDEVVLTGKYFMDVQSLAFQGAEVTDYTLNSSESITFKIPEGAAVGPITITTASGSANSVFHYKDTRNILFDFDGTRGGFATGNGWRAPASGHIHTPGQDSFDAIDGSYLWLGGQDGGLKAGSTDVWAEDPYSFNYWNSSDESSSVPPLKSLPTFASYIKKYGVGGLALKFECIVPSSNPWMTCSMQLIFTRSSDTSNENMTNAFFSDATLPRALWTPWQGIGSYDTEDRWVTVSVPLTDFTMTHLAETCATSFDDKFLEGFSLFVWGGLSGTECDPVIAIDNIRVVPM